MFSDVTEASIDITSLCQSVGVTVRAAQHSTMESGNLASPQSSSSVSSSSGLGRTEVSSVSPAVRSLPRAVELPSCSGLHLESRPVYSCSPATRQNINSSNRKIEMPVCTMQNNLKTSPLLSQPQQQCMTVPMTTASSAGSDSEPLTSHNPLGLSISSPISSQTDTGNVLYGNQQKVMESSNRLIHGKESLNFMLYGSGLGPEEQTFSSKHRLETKENRQTLEDSSNQLVDEVSKRKLGVDIKQGRHGKFTFRKKTPRSDGHSNDQDLKSQAVVAQANVQKGCHGK